MAKDRAILTKKEVGKLVLETRMFLGLSAEKLAATLGLSRNSLSKVEKGLFYPSYTTIARFSKFIGSNPSVFFATQDENAPELDLLITTIKKKNLNRTQVLALIDLIDGVSNSEN